MRVVDRVEEPELTLDAQPGEPAEVGGARRGIDHDGQRGRVRRDDDFIAEAPFQPEPRDAERLVLVGAVPIDDVVGGLGDAPGHAARGGVVHLPAHDQPARVVEQRVRGGPHDQQRHEVLEQRRAPREQHGCSPHARHRPPEVEPVHLRHVPLGDREEAGQPGFGRQQIVVGRIQPAGAVGIRQAVPDREQLPDGIQQEAEVHGLEEHVRARRQRRREVPEPDGKRQEGARQVAAVHGGDIGGCQRRQRLRVVPVQQVAFESFEPLHGRERGVDSSQELRGLDEPQVVSGQRGEKAEADVGGRRPVRDGQLRTDLHVVGRQIMVRRTGERVEVPPRLPRNLQQIRPVGGRQRRPPARRGAAQCIRDPRSGYPQREHREGDRERRRPHEHHDQQRRDCQQRTRRHTAKKRAPLHRAAADGACGRRLPLQQAPAGDDEADEGDRNGVQPLARLVRHEGELQPTARPGGLQIVARRAQERAPRLAGALDHEEPRGRVRGWGTPVAAGRRRSTRGGGPAGRSTRAPGAGAWRAAPGCAAGCRGSSSAR